MGAQQPGAAAAAGKDGQDLTPIKTRRRDTTAPSQVASMKGDKGSGFSLCFVCQNVVTNDQRVLTEAHYLAERGVAVSAVGFLRKGLSADECHGSLRIVRVPPLPRTRDLFRRWMRRQEQGLSHRLNRVPSFLTPWARHLTGVVHGGGAAIAWPLAGLDWILYPTLRRIQLVRAARRIGAPAYHAHFPLSLFLLVWFMCLLSRKRFVRDYRDAFPGIGGEESGLASHYHLPATWDKPADEAAEHRILDTLDMIPPETDSVLDVGAGDGRIINRLVDRLPTAGALDISLAAVKRAKGERFLASAGQLPFASRSFDLIVAAEVLEHLPRRVYRQALGELERVADRYILVGVPNDETLSLSRSRCPRCGFRFHVNLHQRSFSSAHLRRLFKPHFRLKAQRETGGTRRSYNRSLFWIRCHLGGIWPRSATMLCPRCSFRPAVGPLRESNAIERLCNRLNQRLAPGHRQASPSHLLALYQRKGC